VCWVKFHRVSFEWDDTGVDMCRSVDLEHSIYPSSHVPYRVSPDIAKQNTVIFMHYIPTDHLATTWRRDNVP
jgi:hypothetical protein